MTPLICPRIEVHNRLKRLISPPNIDRTMTVLMILLFFIAGVFRGITLCATVCIPGVVPHVVRSGGGPRAGMAAGIMFSLPRVLVLTALGTIAGATSFVILHGPVISSALWVSRSTAYLLIGLFFVVTGFRVMCRKKTLPQCQRTRFPFILGSALAAGCAIEVTALEPFFVGAVTGSAAGSLAEGALLGGGLMFAFSLGTALPSVIILTLVGFSLATIRHAKTVRSAYPWILMLMGSVMMILGLIPPL